MKKIKLTHNSQGFTLIELLLYVGLISIFLGVLVFFFASSASMRVKNQAENDVNQQGTFVMELMTQAIRNADSITTPAANNSAAATTITVPTAANSPTIFQLSGTTLQIKEGSAAAVAITSSSVQVSNLTFVNTMHSSTPGSMQISFTLSSTAGSTRDEFNYSRTFTTSASLRP